MCEIVIHFRLVYRFLLDLHQHEFMKSHSVRWSIQRLQKFTSKKVRVDIEVSENGTHQKSDTSNDASGKGGGKL